MTIEIKKVASANEAIELINRLNFRNNTFQYKSSTYSDDYKVEYRHLDGFDPNGESDGFAMIEIVADGKLQIVRFFNLFRDIAVDFKFGDFNPDYSRFENVIDIDAENEREEIMSTPLVSTDAFDEALYCEQENANWYDVRVKKIAETKATKRKDIADNEMTIEAKTVKGGAVIVKVAGKRVAINKAIAQAIKVEGVDFINVLNDCGETYKINIFNMKFIYGHRVVKAIVDVIKDFVYGEIRANVEVKPTGEADVEDYAISTEAQEVAIDAENDLANIEAAEHIADRHYALQCNIEYFESYGLTQEQAEKNFIATTLGISPKEGIKIIEGFLRENGIDPKSGEKLEADVEDYTVENDGSEEDDEKDNVFSLLPKIEDLNDVEVNPIDSIEGTDMDESERDEFRVAGYKFIAAELIQGVKGYVVFDAPTKTLESAITKIYLHIQCRYNRPWAIKDINGNIILKGNTAADFYKFLVNDTDGSEEDEAEIFTANVMPREVDDADDELIDEPEPDVEVQEQIGDDVITYRNGKVYSVESLKYGSKIFYDFKFWNVDEKIAYATKPLRLDGNGFDNDLDFWSIEDFWLELSERGAISFDNSKSESNVDDFLVKLEELDKKITIAEIDDAAAREAEVRAYNAWQAAKRAAEESAEKLADAYRNYNRLGVEKARELRDKLLTNDIFLAKGLSITNQQGEVTTPDLTQIWIYFRDGAFEIEAGNVKFGIYDTPAQIEAVITMFKAAIARGDKEFTFPTIEELNSLNDILSQIDTINSISPENWHIELNSAEKNYPVKFNGKTIATLDTLTLAKALPPDKFFDLFRPLIDKDFSPKEQFINDRLNELNDLIELQKFVGNDKERLKTLSDMIEQLKRDILQAEFDYNEK